MSMLVLTCNPSKGIASGGLNTVPKKIIFLNYSIEKLSNGNRAIQFINKKIVAGKLKHSKPSINAKDGDLVCDLRDKKDNIIKSIIIKNPLKKHLEYIDEFKNLKTKVVKLKQSQFSIRLQLNNAITSVTISNFAETTPLIKTKIY